MKNHSLSLQIWIVIAIITVFISGVFVFILPSTLRDFFTTEMYSNIRTAQESFNKPSESNTESGSPDFSIKRDPVNEDARRVKHFILHSDGRFSTDSIYEEFLSIELIERAKNHAFNQKNNSEEYLISLKDEKIFYIITKANLEEQFGPLIKSEDVFLVSFLNDSYRDDLVRTLYNKLFLLAIIILFLSWIPAIFFSKYLSNPLVNLEKKVEKLTNRKWDEEILMDRRDEIGKLGNSIEKLRRELIRQDKSEQAFLQNISHELKTPIMVIKSYSQAISDGVFPEGDLESSLAIIDEETERLEDKVGDLLYLTRLDYMSNLGEFREDFSFDKLIFSIAKKLSLRSPNINWNIDLQNMTIHGDMEQMQIVVENLLDNAIRHAHSNIHISEEKIQNGFRVKFWNDGDLLDEISVNTIFEKFHKGKNGEIGLGLSIVKRILDMHNYTIFARNEDNGVSFYIDIIEG